MSWTRVSFWLLLGVLLCGWGCGPLIGAKRADKSFFVLSDDKKVPEGELRRYSLRLLVRDTKANRFINSHKIIFSEKEYTRGYYQFAHWVEPPPERFTLLLINRLERAEVFGNVSRLASSTLGDLQINTEIVEFYHNIADMPGDVVIRVNAELFDLKDRRSSQKKSFSRSVEVSSYSAAGAVKAFSKGVNEILDEMVVWVGESVPLISSSPSY